MSVADLIPISEKTTIAGACAEVWPLICDPMRVVSCVPGAAITAQRPDGMFDASITVKFGPTVATFTGEVGVEYDHAAMRCTVNGRAIDQRGASRALVSAVVTLAGGEKSTSHSELLVDGGFNVAGPLEAFASAGGVHVARALLGEFAKNIAAVIEARRAVLPSAGGVAPGESVALPEQPRAAAQLQGGKLLWTVLVSWLRQLFAGRK